MDKTKQQVFTDKYANRSWDQVGIDNESVSGPGSTLQFTANLRSELPQLFKQFGIRTVFDAPCGDLNWMKEVLTQCPDIDYTGGDIVEPLIKSNTKVYGSRANTRFVNIDIINDPLPAADLMICRDCLFHFSEADIKQFFRNFVASDILALLVTCEESGEANRDIETGGYRHTNLLIEPYNFERNYIYAINDWPYTSTPIRKMYMWSREQIAEVVKNF
jgi:Methyltransferase domain